MKEQQRGPTRESPWRLLEVKEILNAVRENAGFTGEKDKRHGPYERWQHERQSGDCSKQTPSRKCESFKEKREWDTNERTQHHRRDRKSEAAHDRLDHDTLRQNLSVIRECPRTV